MTAHRHVHVNVSDTHTEPPAFVIRIEYENPRPILGYNVEGFRASMHLTDWLHSQPDLLNLYRLAYDLSCPDGGEGEPEP